MNAVPTPVRSAPDTNSRLAPSKNRNAPAYSINMPTDEITPARHITPLRAKTREAFSWNNANRAATSANATVDQAYMENEHDANPVPFAT